MLSLVLLACLAAAVLTAFGVTGPTAGGRVNYSGDVLLAAPTGGVTAGLVYNISNRYMVARQTAAATVVVPFAMDGAVTVTKNGATGLTLAVGQKVYWISATKKVTSAATGNTLIGTAISVAAATDTMVDINIDGLPPTAS